MATEPYTSSTSATSTAAKVDANIQSPPLVYRWLHGGPPLDDLTSIPLSTNTTSEKSSPPSTWRDFTEAENDRLEAAWKKLEADVRERAWRSKVKSNPSGTTTAGSGKDSAASSRRSSMVNHGQEKPGVEKERDTATDADTENALDVPDEVAEEDQAHAHTSYIADEEQESQPHVVHVSQDNLFSADLKTLSLYPVFWKGARIGIQRATWFYPSTSLKKFYPVDPLLTYHLEEAYAEIQPYAPSYADELKSAVEIGSDAEAKLKHVLHEVGVDVIFQGPDSARVYARNLGGRLSKSFLTSFLRDKGHSSGGTLIYRGYDTLISHIALSSKSGKAKSNLKDRKDTLKAKTSVASLRGDATSDSEAEGRTHSEKMSPTRSDQGGKKDTTTAKPPVASTSRFANLFSLGYGKVKTEEKDSAGNDNTTSEAMDASQGDDEDDDGEEAELAQLVLIIHGIGQKLATTYESFNIVHAINQMRKLCNQQAREPALKKLIGNKRIQIIPLQWRSSLQFEEMQDDDEQDIDSQLDNRFSINDIQVQGAIPFVQSLVTGVGLDLAFYLSHHRDRMTATVVRDANRIYRLFRQRNPSFQGKVSICAHSLGTALATDILSRQPTWVPDLDDMKKEQRLSDEHFAFNVSTAFFLGSPVGYMFFLNRAQLVARKGRARTKDAPRDIALDKVGRYGCMAIDSLYNVYNIVDPVACCLNACVDVDYAKVVKPLPISSVTSSMLSEYTAKVSEFFSSLLPSWPSSTDKASHSDHHQQQQDPTASLKSPPTSQMTGGSAQDSANSNTQQQQQQRPAQRPKTKRQITSEFGTEELRRFERAEKRMLALNPQGSIDFYLTNEGFSAYYEMLISHASYWHDPRFTSFVLTQLLASPEDLSKSRKKREEDEEKEAEEYQRGKKG